MERYEKYKNENGVVIPQNWKCPTLKHVCVLKSGNSDVQEIENGDIPFVRVSDMNLPDNNIYIKTSTHFVEKKTNGNRIFPIGSVIFPKRGGAILTNKRRIVCREICCDLNVMGAIPKSMLLPKHLYYYLVSKDFKDLVNGSAVPQINNGDLEPLKFPLPPLAEQQAIVSFLDKKTSAIDSLIADKENVIGMLQDAKQTIIAKAVTRGLDPNVELKDSGNMYLGNIPANWSSIKMKYLFTERSEKNHPNEQMLSATQTEGVIPQSMYKNRVVVVNSGFENLKFVKVGDFVIHLRSFQGGIEYAYYQGIISAAYTVLEPKEPELTEYYKYLFKSSEFIDLLKTCVTGIREGQNINYSKLKQSFIPKPTNEDAKQIVTYITEKTSAIDSLVNDLQEEIELLKEYKQRLISDAVTGQIKVC